MTTLQSPEISLSLGEEIRHSDYNQEEADEEKDEAGNLTATFHPPSPLINQHQVLVPRRVHREVRPEGAGGADHPQPRLCGAVVFIPEQIIDWPGLLSGLPQISGVVEPHVFGVVVLRTLNHVRVTLPPLRFPEDSARSDPASSLL